MLEPGDADIVGAAPQSHEAQNIAFEQAAGAIAVIIVNWNRSADTLRCLGSLAASDGPSHDIIVVDNASTDGSVDDIRASFPDVHVIANVRNDGFAEGNNIALRMVLRAGYDYVLLLNNDTVVAPDAVSLLLAELRNNSHVGIVSPAICYLSRPTTIWSAGGDLRVSTGEVTSVYLDVALDDLPGEPYSVHHVSGCCMLLRAGAIRDSGLLDPRFFMYYEETEWCARIARRGYAIRVVPRAVIWHAIEPARQEGSPAIAYYMTRNHLLYLKATRAPVSAWALTVARQVRTVASLFIKPSNLARSRGRVPMLRAMRDFALGRFGPQLGG